MNEAPLSLLLGALVVLLLLSAFFSSSETGMMTLNRYRLRHKARNGHRAALRTSELLNRTDHLIGVILIGNNFVNILASAIATTVAVRIWGDTGIAIATIGLTLVILIFGEVTPKTLAARHPEKIAFPASLILKPMLKIFYPLVWIVNGVSNVLLRCLGINPAEAKTDQLSQEELRTIVHEADGLISRTRKSMLLSILDLENVSVDDIMIPRNEIVGINIEESIEKILEQLRTAQHTRLPIFKGNINNIIGMLHMRKVARLLNLDEINSTALLNEIHDTYFVPEGTPLHTQLFNFQKVKLRTAIVIDEYGDVIGLVTLEDILEEIVGEFTTNVSNDHHDIAPQPDGTFIIDGTATIRDINKALEWQLPLDGPKTLNGLVTEHLEEIPDTSVCIIIGPYRMEILKIQDNRIRSVLIYPPKTSP